MAKRIETHDDLLDFYRAQTEVSDPASQAFAYETLPGEVAALCAVLQGLLIHMWWIGEKTYGFTRQDLEEDGRDVLDEIGLRTAEQMIDKILAMDARPLAEPREARRRLVGNCRDYTLLLVSILRHRGVPARARTGAGRYFYPDGSRLEDHWICEWWNAADERWQQTDAQLDDVMKQAMALPFDATDLPSDQFLTGWQCHDEVAEGRIEPKRIGYGEDFAGLAYTRHKMLVDLVSLTGEELLPWAGWGIGSFPERAEPGDDELADRIFRLLRSIDEPSVLQEARELIPSHPRLRRLEGYDPGPFRQEWLDA